MDKKLAGVIISTVAEIGCFAAATYCFGKSQYFKGRSDKYKEITTEYDLVKKSPKFECLK